MAAIGDLVANLAINRRGFSAGLGGARNELASFSMYSSGLLGGIGAQFGVLAAAAGAFAALKIGVGFAADAETTQIAFEVMIGSAERAKQLLYELKQFSDKSPLSMLGVQDGAKMLMQYDTKVQDVIPTIKMLGDIAGANEEKFQNLAYAFAQVTGYGYLQGQELRQLVNAGWNPLLDIQRKTGESIATLRDRMAAHKISSMEVAEALKSATSEGGRFNNMTDRQARTLTGRFSTMKDEIVNTLRELGQALVETLDIKGWVSRTTDFIREIPFAFKNLTPLIQVTLLDWTIEMETWASGAGSIMINVGIVFSSAWEAMGKNFETFMATMRAGFQEIGNLAKAANAGLGAVDNDARHPKFWLRNGLDWMDRNLSVGAKEGETADFLFGKVHRGVRVDPKTGKPLGFFEAMQKGANRELAGQKDPIKPGTDLVSQFKKNMEEQNKAARDALGGKPLLQGLKDRKEGILNELGAQQELEKWRKERRAADGALGESFKKNDPLGAGKDKGVSRAALKGTADANKILTAGIGGIGNQQLKLQQKQLAVEQEIAKNTSSGGGGQPVIMAAHFA